MARSQQAEGPGEVSSLGADMEGGEMSMYPHVGTSHKVPNPHWEVPGLSPRWRKAGNN